MTIDTVALGCLLLGAFALFLRWQWREDAMRRPMARRLAIVTDVERRRERVLFLCTHNSARSQMAEALLDEMAGRDDLAMRLRRWLADREERS